MSQNPDIAAIIEKALAEPAFRARLLEKLEAALQDSGLVLTDELLNSLRAIQPQIEESDDSPPPKEHLSP